MWDQKESYDLDTSVSYKRDNSLLKLMLQKSNLKKKPYAHEYEIYSNKHMYTQYSNKHMYTHKHPVKTVILIKRVSYQIKLALYYTYNLVLKKLLHYFKLTPGHLNP